MTPNTLTNQLPTTATTTVAMTATEAEAEATSATALADVIIVDPSGMEMGYIVEELPAVAGLVFPWQGFVIDLNDAGRRRLVGENAFVHLYFSCAAGVNGLYLTQPSLTEFVSDGTTLCIDLGSAGPGPYADLCHYTVLLQDNGRGDVNPASNTLTVHLALAVKSSGGSTCTPAMRPPASAPTTTWKPAVKNTATKK
jgi:hypothetical protein